MALVRCPICGEAYDDTYKACPFCEEDDAAEQGVKIRRNNSKPGRRASNQMNLLTPTLTVLILIMAALLVYLLFGDTIAEKLGMGDPSGAHVEEPVGNQNEQVDPEPVVPPEEVEPADPLETLDYAAAAALPAGLSLSTTDFSLFNVSENHTIQVSGGSGKYRWFSQDPAVATVDADGKVTALSRGTIQVVVTDGEKQGTCIVRCQVSGGSTTTTTPPQQTQTETPATSGLKAGAGKVVNAGSGVRVRAEANTNCEVLATLSNGSSVEIVSSAGDGWYKITFSNQNGVKTNGYMKGDYLANR